MSRHTALGELELLVLLALVRLGPGAYGVTIGRDIETAGNRHVSLGGVYAALERLEAKGMAGSELGEATPERGGRAKRYFHITTKGSRTVEAAGRAVAKMWRGIPAFEGGPA